MVRCQCVPSWLLAPLLIWALSGCSYLHFASVQAGYERTLTRHPSQWAAKHSLATDTHFVYGRLLSDKWLAAAGHPMAIAALSSRFKPDELVEINQLGQPGSFYGLNLPPGDYRLLVFADANRNGVFEPDEIVGERDLDLGMEEPANRVVGEIDIEVSAPRGVRSAVNFEPAVVDAGQAARTSLFYPKGTLRALDDPLFSPAMSQLGMYDPAAFIEAAPVMFYALEEEFGHKVPVIFVHGIDGSPAQFKPIIDRMDRTRYKPWLFFYPSGGDLEQLAKLFRNIFLSGKVIPTDETSLVIIAHSMGGLVVREAMNQCKRDGCRNKGVLIITIATPFGGEPSAGMGVARAPMVLPAWRGLDPGGHFIRDLYRRPLPDGTTHQLLYTYRDTQDEARGTDGVVPLSSQLAANARAEAIALRGFKSGHAEVLRDPAAVGYVLELMSGIRGPFPEDQLHCLLLGGFDAPLGPAYSEMETYAIRNYGRFLRAMAAGKLHPFHPLQVDFVGAVRGLSTPTTPFETAWIKFRHDYPGLSADDPASPAGCE